MRLFCSSSSSSSSSRVTSARRAPPAKRFQTAEAVPEDDDEEEEKGLRLLALLAEAVRKGRVKKVSELLDAGASVAKLHSVYGTSALHVAAALGRSALARVVLEKSPKCDVAKLVEVETKAVVKHVHVPRDLTGVTPLFLACACGHLSVARLLVEFGADPNRGDIVFDANWCSKNRRRCTPLTGIMNLHTLNSRKVASVVRLLLEAGADPDKPDESGHTPLFAALAAVSLVCRGKRYYAADNSLVRLLLEAGADPDKPGVYGEAPLFAALGAGGLQALITLLENKADPNCKRPSDGNSPLGILRGDSAAVQRLGPAKRTKALLDHGAKPC